MHSNLWSNISLQQQGGQLLQQALQQGAQLAANGAQSKTIYFF
jgi:hypothetical protein